MIGKWIVAFVLLVLCSQTVFSQEWKDTLNDARKFYKKGLYKEALKKYNSTERLAPKDVNLSEEKGQAAYKAGDFKTAEASYEKAVEKTKDVKRKVAANNNLGNARLKQNNYAGAEEAFKQSLRLDPSNEQARQQLAEAKRMKKQEEQKQKQNQDKQQDSKDQQNDPQKKNQPKPDQINQSKPDDQKGQQQQKGKLEDKETERKLDEISRQEQGTKKRLDGSKGSKGGKSARKDW